AVCEAIKTQLVRSGVPESKIHVIYSGTDTDRFHPGVDRTRIRAELGLTPGEFLVTQIGVRAEKGNDDVMAAMAGVTAPGPPPPPVLFGAPDPTRVHAAA